MQLLIIADLDDSLATQFAEYAAGQGHPCALLDMKSAAQRLTISFERTSKVTPAASLFLRLPTIRYDDSSCSQQEKFDREFLREEAHAHIWSAAALTTAPVINRPSHLAFCGSFSELSSVRDARAGIRPGFEVYHSKPLLGGAGRHRSTTWWSECESTGERFFVDGDYKILTRGPFRSRTGPSATSYIMQCVVAENVFHLEGRSDRGGKVAEESFRVACRTGLNFALVVWLETSGRGLTLVALSPSPTLQDLGRSARKVFSALLEELRP